MVLAIIALLMAVLLPAVSLARQHAAEAMCRSNLRQMTVILKTYCLDHDNRFPDPTFLYHSAKSLDPNQPVLYPMGCRWHDARIGPGSPFLIEHPELQGALIPYLGNPKILVCRTGARANTERGCSSWSPVLVHVHSGGARAMAVRHNKDIPIIPQYTYTMNGTLCRAFRTADLLARSSAVGADAYDMDPRTLRRWEVRRETQVTRSPAEVFVFGEENSWAINEEVYGEGTCNLSGLWPTDMDQDPDRDMLDSILAPFEFRGVINTGSLDIAPSYVLATDENRMRVSKVPNAKAGSAFATCHRPRGGDLNTGHSYVSLLDGHVQKVTVADQLRRSRRVENLPDSRLGPGGNLHLAWPLNTPPLGGWENQ